MQLQTKVRLPEPLTRQLSYGAKILSMGSCFSEHIGRYLEDLGHHIVVNPFGVVYNPVSMALSLARLLQRRPFDEIELFQHKGLYHSRMHHGSYSALSVEQCLELINRDYNRAIGQLQNLDYLMLTWGTAWVYRDAQGVVANCHKRPERDFERRLWSVGELLESVKPTLQTLLEQHPHLQIITTISPIRHLRDTAHGNQLSKATLLLMDEALRASLPEGRYHYFPAYEIVLDELRDYRFYADDMIHPSTLTQKYIAESYAEWLMTKPALDLSRHIARLKAQAAHRPLHADSLDSQLQREQLDLLIEHFRREHPEVLWT